MQTARSPTRRIEEIADVFTDLPQRTTWLIALGRGAGAPPEIFVIIHQDGAL
jgi:hypothetical protein